MTGNQAGQSAEEIARRTRDKIERLQRAATAWEAGAAGEQATGQTLAQLDSTAWRVLHDVRWPGRARANIDHVVIGPPGVFVIDSKNWSGRVAVTDGVLRQNGRPRESAVVGVAEAGIAILELAPDVPVHPVLCLVRDEPAQGWVRDVMLCSTVNLLALITSRPAALTTDEVRRVSAAIQAGLAAPASKPRPKPAARPGGSRPTRQRRSTRKRSEPSLVRLLGFLLMALLMLGALQTGLFHAVATKISEVVVGEVVDDPPAKAPAEQPRRATKQKDASGNG